MLPRLGLPDRLLTVLVILAVIGFPIALTMSWVFRLVPEGAGRASSPASELEDPGTDGAVQTPVGARRRLATLAIATAAFGAAAAWWIPRAPAFRAVEVDPDAIAILPFEVRGSDEVAYLRDGMVDLLSTKLDGVGGLRVIDPQTTFAAIGPEPEGRRTADQIRAVAAGLGAARAVHGSVLWVGDSLQVRASVYGVGDRSTIDASVSGSAGELFGLVDRLASTLVAGGVIADDAQLVGLEALTTTSTDALRLYLDGVRNHRAGRGSQETLEPLRRAVAIDSSFALAALWAGYLSVWLEVGDPVDFFRLANRHSARLAPRERLRVQAALAAAEGRYADAITLYAGLVERYPEDLGGWFRYAEELAHSGHFVGRSVVEARPAYERVLGLWTHAGAELAPAVGDVEARLAARGPDFLP